ncbi:MAG TPA: MFS transporter [Chloroflexota bacterium]|nr:MFS transporter [Chloroflexota bacterium]
MFKRSIPFFILATAIFSYNFSLGVSRTIQNNFWVDVLGLRPDQMGLLITARETPGFLTMLVAALTMRFAPSRLASVCFLIMAVGYYAYGLAQSFLGLLPGVLIASSGFHLWITLNSAFGLAVAKEDDAGKTLGDLQAVGFLAGLIGMLGVLIGIGAIGFRTAFAISGVAMLLGAVIITRFPNHLVHRSPQRAVVRRRYRLFYVLNFLEGCRFELFQAFGVFLLVQVYHLAVQAITVLFIINAIGSLVLSPPIGRLIDRFGERPVMFTGYMVMLFSFLGFAWWHDTTAAIGLYVIYNLVLLCEIGVNTYLKKVADPKDVRPSLATGVTVMHVPALVVPILGGALWNAFGFEIPFLLGACFISGSLIASLLIPSPRREANLQAVVVR